MEEFDMYVSIYLICGILTLGYAIPRTDQDYIKGLSMFDFLILVTWFPIFLVALIYNKFNED